jgi:tRNA(His) guanylyltransferase
MKFDDLDKRMRVFETAHDQCVLPGVYMVARLDGRSFTRLTKDVHKFDAPYDEHFRDHMLDTTRHMMDCGFKVIYGYTQSDEISLLFSLQEASFGRKMRKLNSVLAGEASARFSLLLGDIGVFDCRISQLPGRDFAYDYFCWRQEDASRNALNGYCYWSLRKQGKTVRQATQHVSGMSVAEKNELLFSFGINFNDLPGWQRRGIGLYWEAYEKQASNPLTGKQVVATRRRIRTDLDLPIREDYRALIAGIIDREVEISVR